MYYWTPEGARFREGHPDPYEEWSLRRHFEFYFQRLQTQLQARCATSSHLVTPWPGFWWLWTVKLAGVSRGCVGVRWGGVNAINSHLVTIVREKRMKHGKKRKSHEFWILKKNVRNVEVITYRPVGLKITVTTLNQFCCPSHNTKTVIFSSKMF